MCHLILLGQYCPVFLILNVLIMECMSWMSVILVCFQNCVCIMSSGDELAVREGPSVDSDAPVCDYFMVEPGSDSCEMPRLTFGGRSGEVPRSGSGFGEVEAASDAGSVEVDVMATLSEDEVRSDPNYLANQYGEYIIIVCNR